MSINSTVNGWKRLLPPALLSALFGTASCQRGPEMPPEGNYLILNEDAQPVKNLSVSVVGSEMIVSWIEASGNRRRLVYTIEPID